VTGKAAGNLHGTYLADSDTAPCTKPVP
jgi:hypothetical protein